MNTFDRFHINGKQALSIVMMADGRIMIAQDPDPDCEYGIIYVEFEDAEAIGKELIRLSRT